MDKGKKKRVRGEDEEEDSWEEFQRQRIAQENSGWRRPFTEEEGDVIIAAQKEFGNQWKVIAPLLFRRTPLQVMRYANRYLKKKKMADELALSFLKDDGDGDELGRKDTFEKGSGSGTAEDEHLGKTIEKGSEVDGDGDGDVVCYEFENVLPKDDNATHPPEAENYRQQLLSGSGTVEDENLGKTIEKGSGIDGDVVCNEFECEHVLFDDDNATHPPEATEKYMQQLLSCIRMADDGHDNP